MSEGNDKTDLGQQNFGEHATQTDGPTQDFRGIGETGSGDLGDFSIQPGGRDETVGEDGGQAQAEEVGDGSAIGGAWNSGEPQQGQPAELDVEDAMDDEESDDIGDGASASSAGGGF